MLHLFVVSSRPFKNEFHFPRRPHNAWHHRYFPWYFMCTFQWRLHFSYFLIERVMIISAQIFSMLLTFLTPSSSCIIIILLLKKSRISWMKKSLSLLSPNVFIAALLLFQWETRRFPESVKAHSGLHPGSCNIATDFIQAQIGESHWHLWNCTWERSIFRCVKRCYSSHQMLVF